MKPRQSFSWLANKFLKVRDEVYKWIKLRIGNGVTCRFWSDIWFPFGKLLDFFPSTTVSRFGIPKDATLHQLFINGRWVIPPARSENQVSLHIFLTTLILNDTPDYYVWELEGKEYTRYSTGLVYRLLRDQSPQVPWKFAVWNPGGVPKHSFFTWLLVLNRCPTRDRLLSWGLNTDPNCLLCNLSPESINHIFYNCPFARTIWSSIARRCRSQQLNSWDSTLAQMQSLQGPTEKRRLILLAWQCTNYMLWNERNARLHR
ncbi:Reverse transcriptase zinc-binding domain [Arabidopsis thaliana x Arabidopsis arenosa]|uniref:Reverse transcriptase zinc-binding domain n=1 Tax=Arabidopsis thaliana x Arabidopsis arenosa TaxID=1240361 RepID=A0A8T2A5R1_9BRAS|nr:Reverse transcriptase zinc-binding domain [Arabidopsis thaliana x Arabidopsis arenosa]